MKKFLKEFKEFAIKGNMLDLAVGVMIGTAFNAIIKSLIENIFMPIIGIIIGGKDFSALSVTIGDAAIQYGMLIQNVINFTVTAFVLFILVKTINNLKKKEEIIEEEKPEEPSEEIKLLSEIRDLLKK